MKLRQLSISKYGLLILLLLSVVFVSCSNNKAKKTPVTIFDLVDPELKHVYDSLNQAGNLDATAYVKALHKFFESGDRPTKALTAFFFSNIVYSQDSVIKYAEIALPYFETHPEFVKSLAVCYFNLGVAHLSSASNIFKANYYLNKASSVCMLDTNESRFDPAWLYTAYTNTSICNTLCNQDEKAIHYAKAGLKIAVTTKDSFNQVFSLLMLSKIYSRMKRFDSSAYYISEAQHYVNMAHSTILQNNILEAKALKSYHMGAYDSCIKYYQICVHADSLTGINTLKDRMNMLEAATITRQRSLASGILDTFKMITRELDNTEQMEYYDKKLHYSIIYGNREETEKLFLKFRKLNEEIYRRDRLKMFSAIEPEYDLTQKQKQIGVLQQEKSVISYELKRKQSLMIISIMAVILSIVSFTFLVSLFRQRRLKIQRDKIVLEQRLLRTQMEPHFIFNTLSVLQSQIHNHENEKAGVYLNHFARLLRTSLENSRENFVPLQEEIEALNAYLSLQQMRFENRFDYTLQLYPGFEEDDVQILPMLLQPFVENAIQYGRSPDQGHLQLVIEIAQKEDMLYCHIKDNGGGIETSQKNIQKKSLSTQIIKERLAIVSRQTGRETQFMIQRGMLSGETGTHVTITFPRLTEAMVNKLGELAT